MLIRVALLLALCLSSFAAEVPLTILHTNDHHGRYWKNEKGEGGLAAQMTLAKKVKKENEEKKAYTLILSGGDINTGVPESDFLKAEPDFRGMRFLGYDAAALGNHEFDVPRNELLQQMQWAKFPMLGANIYYKEGPKKGQRAFGSYIVRKIGGLNVVIVGFTTPDTPTIVKARTVRDLEFRDPIEEARVLMPELQAKGDVVIAVTHLGYYENENHGTEAPGDITLAKQAPGFDIIVGGHTHTPLKEPAHVNGTWIVQAGEWSRYVGRLDVVLDSSQPRGHRARLVKYELIPMNLQKDGKSLGEVIPEAPEMIRLLEPFQKKTASLMGEQISFATEELQGGRDQIRHQEMPLAHLVNEAMRVLAPQADVVISNGGSIRDSIYPGAIHMKALLKVHPFQNSVAYTRVNGKDLEHYIRASLAKLPGSGGFAHFEGVTVCDKQIRVGGEPINPKKLYTILGSDFILENGDGLPNLGLKTPLVRTGVTLTRALADWLRPRKKISNRDFPLTHWRTCGKPSSEPQKST